MLKYINVSAPGKLMLFGEHAVVYGHPCLATAVNQRVHVKARFNGKNILEVSAPQLGIEGYKKKVKNLCNQEMPKQVSFIEAIVKRFYEKYGLEQGLAVETKSDFSHSYGFGSSSAVTIATALALTKLYSVKISKKDLFNLCFKAVLDIQGIGSGFDLAMALWGSTLFYKKGAKVIRELKIKQLPIIVCYSGVKADTPTLVRQVRELKRKHPLKIQRIFKNITDIVLTAESALRQENWQKAGELMNKNQQFLEKLEVSTLKLEKLVKAANQAGAYGSKLSGAGGGDCIIALIPKEKKKAIEQALVEAGGKIMKVKLNSQGATWQKK